MAASKISVSTRQFAPIVSFLSHHPHPLNDYDVLYAFS